MEWIIYGYAISSIFGLILHFMFIDFDKTGKYVTKEYLWFYLLPLVGLIFIVTFPFDDKIHKRYDNVINTIYFLPLLSLLGLYWIL